MRRIYEPLAELRSSFLGLLKKWPLTTLVVVIDLIFLTLFGFLYRLYFEKIMAHATVIMQQTPSLISNVYEQDIYSYAPVLETLSNELFEIKKIAVILAVSILVIWVAFQAVNWWLSFRISGRKISYLAYLKTFSLMSAIWTAIVGAILYITIRMFFNDVLSSFSAPKSSILDVGNIIAILVVGYFAIVSFSLTGKIKDVLKNTVLFSFLKSKVFVAYLFVLVIAFLLNLIVFLLFRINSTLGLVLGAILLLIFFVYARVYMINVVNNIEKTKVHSRR